MAENIVQIKSLPGIKRDGTKFEGDAYVDGQLVGNTPKANLGIAPGPHTIRVVREGFEPFERAIQVAPGQVVRLTDIVLVERRP